MAATKEINIQESSKLHLSFWKGVSLLALGFLIIGAAQAITLFLAERNALQKYQNLDVASWTMIDWVTALLCMVSAIFIVPLLVPSKTELNEAVDDASLIGKLLFWAANLLFLSSSVFIIWFPQTFIEQCAELASIALLQEVFILGGVAYLIVGLKGAFTEKLPPVFKIPAPVIILTLIASLTFLFLEEISYGQHLFGWATPDSFSQNVQNETNLHNFYTYRFELVYYSAAIICFMILPILKLGPLGSRFANIFAYVPPIEFALASLPLSVLIFESWSIVAYQLYFFLALFVSIVFLVRSEGFTKQRVLITFVTAMIYIAATNIFADHIIEGHEPAEMRELSIAIYIAAYGAWLYWSTKRKIKA